MCDAASADDKRAGKNVRKNAKHRNKAFAKQGSESIVAAHFERRMGRYPSGQRGQTVNLLAYAYAGSNPALPTTFILSELRLPKGSEVRQVKISAVHLLCIFSVQFLPYRHL